MKKLSVELTEDEYSELLAKLANELEDYADEASDGLKKSFMKIAKTELFTNNETTLVKKFKKQLEKEK